MDGREMDIECADVFTAMGFVELKEVFNTQEIFEYEN